MKSDIPVVEGHSLRRRLILLLLACVIGVAAVQGFVAWRAALAQADATFDYQMRQLALAFRADSLDLTSDRPQREVDDLDFVVQIWTEDGRRLYRSTKRRTVPASRDPGFSVVQTGESTWRVFSLRNQDRFVQVAQDMHARAAQARSMAFASAAPILALVPLLMGMMWWVVTRSLAPVRRVRAQLARRSATELAPVSEPGLPAEISPLVSEFNALLQRVNRAFEAQQNFVADAAHELRSPLAALKLQLCNLRDADGGAERDLALVRLEQGVARAARLVDQLMALARQESASPGGLEMADIDLADCVRQVVAELAPSADLRDIEIGSSGNESTRVSASREAIEILLSNLIGNAIKYTPRGGVVDVAIERQDQRVALVIEDSGPGIDPRERERVLDRFYRATNSVQGDDEDVPGSGLGLAIVSAIARRHDAQLQLARSPRLGGLRVSVSFSPGSP